VKNYFRDLSDVGNFLWRAFGELIVISLMPFLFGGYYFFGIYLFQKRKKPRNWKFEIALIILSLICAEYWFWIMEGERLVREGDSTKVIINQNSCLLIPAICWYLALFLTRFKNAFVNIPTVLLGAASLLGLLLINAFYFIGTP
jgi:hypothetical protein